MEKTWGFLLICLATVSHAENPCCSYPCENGGVCLTKGFNGYTCDCTRTGFYGENCETPTFFKMIKLWLKPDPDSIHSIFVNNNWFWGIVNRVPFMRDFLLELIYTIRTDMIDIPPTYDNTHTYITLDANFNTTQYTRTLPPVPKECPTPMGVAGKKTMPDLDSLVKKLFVREKFKPEPTGLSALLSFYAQHFTHQYFKTDFKKGPEYQWGQHAIDVAHIYGRDKHNEALLRSFIDGKLKVQTINGEDYPPLSKDVDIEMTRFFPFQPESSFALAHPAFGNLPGLLMFSTVWIREHNRVCDVLKKEHPEWDDEQLYQTGKLVILGETIKISIGDYTQTISNYNFDLDFKPELLFRHSFQYNNRIAVEFKQVYHWHPLMPDDFTIGGVNYTMKDFLTRQDLLVKHGLATFVDSLSKQNAGAFTVKNHGKFTLKVLKDLLQDGRTLRLQSFNNYRKRFLLKPYKTFQEMTGETVLAKELENMYGDVDAVEFYVGLICEKRRPRAVFGQSVFEIVPTYSFKGMLSNPICSPKYWKPSTFGGDVGFDIVNSATIESLFCKNIKGKCPTVSFRVPGWKEDTTTTYQDCFSDCPKHGEL